MRHTPQPAFCERYSNELLLTDAQPLKPLRFKLQLNPNVPYLSERGLRAETITKYGLGLCTRGMLAGYIAIPIFDYPARTSPVAYLGRWPGEDFNAEAGRPRYKWPNGFEKSRVVFGLNEALEDTGGQPLIVVEGPFKVFHLTQCGFRNSVATFGSSLSDRQAEILIGTKRPIVLMFDPDDAGDRGMRDATIKLVTRTFVGLVQLPIGQDVDSLSESAVNAMLH